MYRTHRQERARMCVYLKILYLVPTEEKEVPMHPPKAEFSHYFEYVGYLITDIDVTSNKFLNDSVQNGQHYHTYASFVVS